MSNIRDFFNDRPEGFLTKSQIIERCKILNNYAWPVFEQNEDICEYSSKIRKILVENLGFLPAINKTIDLMDWDLTIFRARIFDDLKNHDAIKEYSYPPAEYTVLNRCNFPKAPVFYGSHNPNAAMLEVIREYNFKNKKISLGVWKVKKIKGQLKYENFLNSGLHPDSFYNHFPNKLKSNISSIFDGDNELIEAVVEYRKFIETQFINDKSYGLSAALAHQRLFSKGPNKTDILMYPSVQSQGYETNFAINPSFVDNYLELKRIYVVTLPTIEIGKENYSVIFQKFAEVKNEKIEWKEIDENGGNLAVAIREDFGQEVSLTKYPRL